MDDISTIASPAPSKGMNDLYQKINKYVCEIRMMELDESLYGMNRTKIDKEKAYDIIVDTTDSDSNPLILFWKAAFVDPYCEHCNRFELSRFEENESRAIALYEMTVDSNIERLSRFEENESRAIALYEMTVDSNIERMAEDGDRYACTCLGWMYHHGRSLDQNYQKAVKWYRKAAEQGHADAQFNLGRMYLHGLGVDANASAAVKWFREAVEQGHADAHV